MDKRPFAAYRGDEPYVFVSYAHADSARVYPLLIALKARGVNIWYDEGIEPGSKWREELSAAIHNAEKVLFVASKKSVASPNCERELDFALSANVPVRVVYIEKATLPHALSFSLGSHQAIVATHYDDATFQEKVYETLTGEPETLLGRMAVARRKRGGLMALALAAVMAPLLFLALRPGAAPDAVNAPPIDITPSLEEPVRIAVRPLRNVTGEAELDWIGDGLANLLRDQLSASRYAVVLSPVAWRNIAEGADNEAALAEKARATGIDYLVSGEVLGEAGELLTTVRVTNLRAGIDVMAQTYPDLTAQELVRSASRVGLNVKQAMKIPREAGLQSLSADFVTQNIAAYEAYIDGLQHYNRFEYEEAEKDLRAALSLADDFHIARYRLADILSVTSRGEAARAELAKIPDDAPLDARERAYIDAFRHVLAGETDAAIAAYDGLLETFPYEIEAQQLLARAYFDAFQIEKGAEILEALRVQEPENPHVLGALGYQLTSIGETQKAAEVLRDYIERYPETPNAWELNGSLKLRQGDLAGARADFEKALGLDAAFTAARIGLAKAQALEGRLAAAAEGFTAIRDDESLPPRHRIDAAFDLAYVRRAEERPQDVAAALTPVQALVEDEVVRAGLYGYVLAQAAYDRGDRDAARTLLAKGASDHPAGGVPTRFAHQRGLWNARAGEPIEAETATLAEFRLPDDNPDRTEDKAILHLEGVAALTAGDAKTAVRRLTDAVNQYGYEYGIYRIELAEALFAAGQRRDALQMIEAARESNESLLSGELRLALLWHRHRAAHIQAGFFEAMGQSDKAAALLADIHAAP